MGTDCKPPKARAPRRRRAPIERIDGRRAAPLLWAKTLAGILQTMTGEITPPRLSLAHTAASLTIRLGKIDAEVAEGREPAADHVRLAGQLNRTLRSLGIIESGSPFSESGAMAGGGASSAQKKAGVEMVTIRDWIYESSRAKDCFETGPECVAFVRASCIAALPTAKDYQILLLRERLAALDEEEERKLTDEEREIEGEDRVDQRAYDVWRTEDRRRKERGEESLPEPRNPHGEQQDKRLAERKLEKNNDSRESFTAHRDSPRSDE